MARLIKRYGSRKLYDTEESRYVSLEELAGWIRRGQEIRVVDNRTREDVTSQTLTQIISEEGRRGVSLLPNEVLHELIRFGEEAVSSGVEQIQNRVDRLMQASLERLGPVRRAREEMARLRERLAELEASLAEIERERVEAPSPPATKAPAGRTKRSTGAKKGSGGAAKATPAKKRQAKKPDASGSPETS